MPKIFPLLLDDELNKLIDEYKMKNHFSSKKEAVTALIKRGLKI